MPGSPVPPPQRLTVGLARDRDGRADRPVVAHQRKARRRTQHETRPVGSRQVPAVEVASELVRRVRQLRATVQVDALERARVRALADTPHQQRLAVGSREARGAVDGQPVLLARVQVDQDCLGRLLRIPRMEKGLAAVARPVGQLEARRLTRRGEVGDLVAATLGVDQVQRRDGGVA